MGEKEKEIFEKQQVFYRSQQTFTYEFRIEQLKKLRKIILENEKYLCEEIYKDFKKPHQETYLTEIAATVHELNHAIKNLKKWMRPKKVRTNLLNFPASSYQYPHPLGLTLIIGAWNYPYFLTLGPLVGCIAAGNTAIIKPSEITPNASRALFNLISKNWDSEYIAVIEGGISTNQNLLALPFDHMFFTGSTQVGKIVMEAASKHLSKVTLELGGKSPAIVDQDADVKKAAKKIVFGKGVNAGQTCIAPDYVYAHEKIVDPLLEELKNAYKDLYPDVLATTHIVNKKHKERLEQIVEGENIYYQEIVNHRADNFLTPILLYPSSRESKAMQDEIFGPILPIIKFKHIETVVKEINDHSSPLALYYFGRKHQTKIAKEVLFGGATINDTLLHIINPYLPFGGVGYSGTGSYHGYSGFTTFSHLKSVLKKGTWLDFSFRYPPYTEKKMRWAKKIF